MANLVGVKLTWTYTPGDGLADDQDLCAIYNDTKKEQTAFQGANVREDEEETFDTSDLGWETTDKLYCYVSFKRADGLDVSNSQVIVIN